MDSPSGLHFESSVYLHARQTEQGRRLLDLACFEVGLAAEIGAGAGARFKKPLAYNEAVVPRTAL